MKPKKTLAPPDVLPSQADARPRRLALLVGGLLLVTGMALILPGVEASVASQGKERAPTQPGSSGERLGGDPATPAVESEGSDATSEDRLKYEDLLELGRLLEEAGEAEKAEELYREVLETDDPEIRAAALSRLEALLDRRESWQGRVGGFFSTVWQTIQSPLLWLVAIGGILWILPPALRALARWRGWGKGRLEVRIQGGTGPEQTAAGHFKDIVAFTLETMNFHFSPDRAIGTIHRHAATNGANQAGFMETSPAKPSVRSKLLLEALGGMLLKMAPGGAGPALLQILDSLNPDPEFLLDCILIEAPFRSHYILSLSRSKEPRSIWQGDFPSNESVEGFKDLAYEVLLVVKKYSEETQDEHHHP